MSDNKKVTTASTDDDGGNYGWGSEPRVVEDYAAGRLLIDTMQFIEQEAARLRKSGNELSACSIERIGGFINDRLARSDLALAVVSKLKQSVASERQANKGKWPWGDYETDLLRKLAGAAENFWTRCDPDDKSTAPINKQVSEWLETQKVAPRTAEYMATILRADGLPPGPRK